MRFVYCQVLNTGQNTVLPPNQMHITHPSMNYFANSVMEIWIFWKKRTMAYTLIYCAELFTKYVLTKYLLVNWLKECKFLICSLRTWGIVISFRSDTWSYNGESLNLCPPASRLHQSLPGTLRVQSHTWWWQASRKCDLSPSGDSGDLRVPLPAPSLGSSPSARYLFPPP